MAATTAGLRKARNHAWLCTNKGQTLGVFSEPEGAHWRHTVYAQNRFGALPTRTFVQPPDDSSRESELIRQVLALASSIEFSTNSLSFTLRDEAQYAQALLQILMACAIYLRWSLVDGIDIRSGTLHDSNAMEQTIHSVFVDTQLRRVYIMATTTLWS